MPRFVMNRWGVAVVVTMLVLSLRYLGRVNIGQFAEGDG
jgi:hypothetical protein